MDKRTRGKLHIVRHTAVDNRLKAENVMNLAQPILPGAAVATLPTRDNLLRNGSVANLNAILFARAFTEFNDFTDKFVSGDDRCLHIRCPMFIAPEKRRAGVALYIAGANAAGVYLDDDFAGPRLRRGNFLKTIIPRFAAHNCAHGFRNLLYAALRCVKRRLALARASPTSSVICG